MGVGAAGGEVRGKPVITTIACVLFLEEFGGNAEFPEVFWDDGGQTRMAVDSLGTGGTNLLWRESSKDAIKKAGEKCSDFSDFHRMDGGDGDGQEARGADAFERREASRFFIGFGGGFLFSYSMMSAMSKRAKMRASYGQKYPSS